jgi:cytochrome c oxidase subunit IV
MDWKAFFENPAQLVGAPLLLIGGMGLAVAATTVLFAPAMQTTTAQGPSERRGVVQPTLETYAGIIGIVLGLTVIELLLFAFGIKYAVFVGILFGMTIVKIALVVMFFFHLKFDNRMFTTAFLSTFAVIAATGVIIVAAIVGNVV